MGRDDRLSGTEILALAALGVGAGLAGGFALGEWIGGVSPSRVRGAARRLRQGEPLRLTPAASVRAVEPLFALKRNSPASASRWCRSPGAWWSCAAGCRPVSRGRWPAERRWPRRASTASSTASWFTAKTTRPCGKRRAPPTRAHDRTARPAIQSVRHRVRTLRLVGGARTLLTRRHRAVARSLAPLRDHDAAAECHGGASHGPRSQQHRPGRSRALRADAGTCGAMVAGHRPRRHRDAERGRANPGGRGAHTVRSRSRGVRRTGLELRPHHRRRHPHAASRSRLLGGLDAHVFHARRGFEQRRARGIRAPPRRGARLSRTLHHQLVSAVSHRALQRRGRKGRGRRTDLAHPLPCSPTAAATSRSPPRAPKPCSAIRRWLCMPTTSDTAPWSVASSVSPW